MWYRSRWRSPGRPALGLRVLVLPALVLLVLVLPAGCGRPEPPAVEPAVRPVPTPSGEQVTLYFPHRTQPVLVKETRHAERSGEQPERFALRQLLTGPQSPDARPVLAGAEFNGSGNPGAIAAKVLEGDVVLVLTRAAAERLAAGGDLTAVYALVNTLAAFPRVNTVRLVAEGGTEPLLVAGVNVSLALSPRWELVQS